jgi:hypothetical protein
VLLQPLLRNKEDQYNADFVLSYTVATRDKIRVSSHLVGYRETWGWHVHASYYYFFITAATEIDNSGKLVPTPTILTAMSDCSLFKVLATSMTVRAVNTALPATITSPSRSYSHEHKGD